MLGWILIYVFLNWFHHYFVSAVTKHMKDSNLALLCLDNAPAHPDVTSLVGNDGNIKAMVLPANTTALSFNP